MITKRLANDLCLQPCIMYSNNGLVISTNLHTSVQYKLRRRSILHGIIVYCMLLCQERFQVTSTRYQEIESLLFSFW